MRLLNHGIFESIIAELHSTRSTFPGNELIFHALTEEVGEAAKALIELAHGNGTHKAVYEEAIQVAVMAIRLASEGEAGSAYDPAKGWGGAE